MPELLFDQASACMCTNQAFVEFHSRDDHCFSASIVRVVPPAALIFMWIITRGIKAYTASYRQECKDLQVDRLFGQVGPRTMRPRFVVVVIGSAP